MKKNWKTKLLRFVVRLPGVLIFIVGILGFVPSLSWLGFVQANIPIIAKIILAAVGLLLIVAPNRVWQIAAIAMAEAKMNIKEKGLRERENRLALYEPLYTRLEAVINAHTVERYLDIDISKIYWQGLAEFSYPYVIVRFDITSRFPLDLVFADIDNILCNLTLVDEKGVGSLIHETSKLVDLQSAETGTPIPFNGTKHIPESFKYSLHFQFRWDNGYTRDKLKNSYKGIPTIKLGFLPKWELKTPDSRPVGFTLIQPIVREFDAPWKNEAKSVLEV